MVATQWHDLFRAPQEWVLMDGSTILEPLLEESESGRRVRLKARPKLAKWAADVEELVKEGVMLAAADAGTRPWFRRDAFLHQAFQKGQVIPHWMRDKKYSYGDDTSYWWKFSHPTIPGLSAVLTVKALCVDHVYSEYHDTLKRHDLNVSLLCPATYAPISMRWNAVWHVTGRNGFLMMSPTPSWYWGDCGVEEKTMGEWLRGDHPELDYSNLFGSYRHESERSVSLALLKRCLEFDSMGEIWVPDFRDPSNPGLLALRFEDSNWGSSTAEMLRDFADVETGMRNATEAYVKLRIALRGLGVHIPKLHEGAFVKALTRTPNPDDIGMSVPVHSVNSDDDHALRVDLATGSFIVECPRDADRNEMGDVWQEVVTLAELMGRGDDLRAFAVEYARRVASGEADARMKAIKGFEAKKNL